MADTKARRPATDDPYRLLLEMSSEAVLLGAGDRIELANEAAALLFGASSAAALLGMPMGRWYPRRRPIRPMPPIRSAAASSVACAASTAASSPRA
jgi:PAS domain-containing protein